MRILHSHIIDGIAGSEGYLLNILPALKERGHSIEFLCLYYEGNKKNTTKFVNKLGEFDISVHLIGVKKFPTYRVLKSIKRVIENGNFDLVHTHLIHADFLVAATKFFLKAAFTQVSTKHGYEEDYTNKYGFDPAHKVKNKYWRILRFAEKRIERSFAISNGLYDLFSGLGICPEEKLDLIHYGFDFSDDFGYVNEYRFGNPQLAMVGRLTGFKGHRYAFKTVQILKKKYPEINLVVVGSGELEAELVKMVGTLGIENNVTFTGFQPNPRDYVYTSDLALLPSVSEGFGLVVLEAMSVKRALVTFDVPSPNELLEHQKTGWMVQPYDVEKYASAIDHLIENKHVRDEIASSAYKRLTSYYNLTRMVDETIEFYQKAVR